MLASPFLSSEAPPKINPDLIITDIDRAFRGDNYKGDMIDAVEDYLKSNNETNKKPYFFHHFDGIEGNNNTDNIITVCYGNSAANKNLLHDILHLFPLNNNISRTTDIADVFVFDVDNKGNVVAIPRKARLTLDLV